MSGQRHDASGNTLNFDGNAAPTALRVENWLAVAAIHGTGSLLLGPHRTGAQAIVPPAVLARTPEGSDDAYSEDGWRVAIWSFADDGRRIDAHRPRTLCQISLDRMIRRINEHAPRHLPWLQDEVIQRTLCLSVLLRHSALPAPVLSEHRVELDDLLLDATRHFGETWVRHHLMRL